MLLKKLYDEAKPKIYTGFNPDGLGPISIGISTPKAYDIIRAESKRRSAIKELKKEEAVFYSDSPDTKLRIYGERLNEIIFEFSDYKGVLIDFPVGRKDLLKFKDFEGMLHIKTNTHDVKTFYIKKMDSGKLIFGSIRTGDTIHIKNEDIVDLKLTINHFLDTGIVRNIIL